MSSQSSLVARLYSRSTSSRPPLTRSGSVVRASLTPLQNRSFSTSMNSETSQNRFAVVLCAVLLAGLLTGQGILRDFVLCLGTDGHVALELATGPGGTCETRSSQEPVRGELSLQWASDNRLGQHCGPCEDFILARTSPTYSEPSRFQFSVSAASQEPLAAVFQSSAAHSRSVKPLDRFHHRGPLPSSLIALRSTILLI